MKYRYNMLSSLIVSVVILSLSACGGGDDPFSNGGDNGPTGNKNANSTKVCAYADRLEFPKLSNNGHSIIIVHKTDDMYDAQGINFVTEWDYQLGSQRWSCYQMHRSNGGWEGKWNRYDNTSLNPSYLTDPDNKEKRKYPWDADLDLQYYTPIDNYYRSGYDHGHICPAGDRSYSFLADKQTFYMTNMQPQRNKFNAGHWAKLEGQVRNWAGADGVENLYVCKGATIDKNEYIIEKINGSLIVPKYFFCALLLKNSLGYKTIAFWMENENVNLSKENLGKFAISVDELEHRTGIDFFCNLPDNIEEDREARRDLNAWGLKE